MKPSVDGIDFPELFQSLRYYALALLVRQLNQKITTLGGKVKQNRVGLGGRSV
jgi:hypothetical protein